jgi:hypothetical protein
VVNLIEVVNLEVRKKKIQKLDSRGGLRPLRKSRNNLPRIPLNLPFNPYVRFRPLTAPRGRLRLIVPGSTDMELVERYGRKKFWRNPDGTYLLTEAEYAAICKAVAS